MSSNKRVCDIASKYLCFADM